MFCFLNPFLEFFAFRFGGDDFPTVRTAFIVQPLHTAEILTAYIDVVDCNALILTEAKEICNKLLLEELDEVKKYCRRIEAETIHKNKLNFMFVLRDVLSNLDECQYFSYS